MFNQILSQFSQRPPKERLAMVGIAALVTLVMTIFYLFITQPRVHLDSYGCPDSGPLENRIIVVDRTGEIPQSAQRAIRTNIETIITNTPVGARISLFEIDSQHMRGLSSALFSKCKVRDGSQANPYNENPELLHRAYEERFLTPFNLALKEVLTGSGQTRSPILEALVDITSVEAFQIPAPTTLYIFSDLLQNSEEYSQYKRYQDFHAASLLPEVNRLVPSLSGANVHLYYLLRTGKELKMQTNDHVQFWLDYLKVAHANVKLVKKIR